MKYSKIYLFIISLLFLTISCDEGDNIASVEDFKAPEIYIDTPVLQDNSVEILLSGWFVSDSRIPRSVNSIQCGFYSYINDNEDKTNKTTLIEDSDYTFDGNTNKVSFSKSFESIILS